MTLANIIPVNPADKTMIDQIVTITAPLKRAATMVLVNKVAPVNNRTMDLANNPTAPAKTVMTIIAPANKVTMKGNKLLTTVSVKNALTMALINRATDLVNNPVMIIA